MDEKLFSVSMCVYYGDNAEQFDAAINSVISQTLPPKEITLVVDGPITEEIEDNCGRGPMIDISPHAMFHVSNSSSSANGSLGTTRVQKNKLILPPYR